MHAIPGLEVEGNASPAPLLPMHVAAMDQAIVLQSRATFATSRAAPSEGQLGIPSITSDRLRQAMPARPEHAEAASEASAPIHRSSQSHNADDAGAPSVAMSKGSAQAVSTIESEAFIGDTAEKTQSAAMISLLSGHSDERTWASPEGNNDTILPIDHGEEQFHHALPPQRDVWTASPEPTDPDGSQPDMPSHAQDQPNTHLPAVSKPTRFNRPLVDGSDELHSRTLPMAARAATELPRRRLVSRIDVVEASGVPEPSSHPNRTSDTPGSPAGFRAATFGAKRGSSGKPASSTRGMASAARRPLHDKRPHVPGSSLLAPPVSGNVGIISLMASNADGISPPGSIPSLGTAARPHHAPALGRFLSAGTLPASEGAKQPHHMPAAALPVASLSGVLPRPASPSGSPRSLLSGGLEEAEEPQQVARGARTIRANTGNNGWGLRPVLVPPPPPTKRPSEAGGLTDIDVNGAAIDALELRGESLELGAVGSSSLDDLPSQGWAIDGQSPGSEQSCTKARHQRTAGFRSRQPQPRIAQASVGITTVNDHGGGATSATVRSRIMAQMQLEDPGVSLRTGNTSKGLEVFQEDLTAKMAAAAGVAGVVNPIIPPEATHHQTQQQGDELRSGRVEGGGPAIASSPQHGLAAVGLLQAGVNLLEPSYVESISRPQMLPRRRERKPSAEPAHQSLRRVVMGMDGSLSVPAAQFEGTTWPTRPGGGIAAGSPLGAGSESLPAPGGQLKPSATAQPKIQRLRHGNDKEAERQAAMRRRHRREDQLLHSSRRNIAQNERSAELQRASVGSFDPNDIGVTSSPVSGVAPHLNSAAALPLRFSHAHGKARVGSRPDSPLGPSPFSATELEEAREALEAHKTESLSLRTARSGAAPPDNPTWRSRTGATFRMARGARRPDGTVSVPELESARASERSHARLEPEALAAAHHGGPDGRQAQHDVGGSDSRGGGTHTQSQRLRAVAFLPVHEALSHHGPLANRVAAQGEKLQDPETSTPALRHAHARIRGTNPVKTAQSREGKPLGHVRLGVAEMEAEAAVGIEAAARALRSAMTALEPGAPYNTPMQTTRRHRSPGASRSNKGLAASAGQESRRRFAVVPMQPLEEAAVAFNRALKALNEQLHPAPQPRRNRRRKRVAAAKSKLPGSGLRASTSGRGQQEQPCPPTSSTARRGVMGLRLANGGQPGLRLEGVSDSGVGSGWPAGSEASRQSPSPSAVASTAGPALGNAGAGANHPRSIDGRAWPARAQRAGLHEAIVPLLPALTGERPLHGGGKSVLNVVALAEQGTKLRGPRHDGIPAVAVGRPLARGRRAALSTRRQLQPLPTMSPPLDVYQEAVKAEEAEAAKLTASVSAASAAKWRVRPGAGELQLQPVENTQRHGSSIVTNVVAPKGSMDAKAQRVMSPIRHRLKSPVASIVLEAEGELAAMTASAMLSLSPPSSPQRVPLATPSAWHVSGTEGLSPPPPPCSLD